MDAEERELKQTLLQEAEEILANAEECFLALGLLGDSPELLNKLFRAVHNLKGSSYAVGFQSLGQFTHKIENLISAIRAKTLALNPRVIDVLLRSNDQLKKYLAELKKDLESSYDTTAIENELCRILEGKEPLTPPLSNTPALPPATDATQDIEPSVSTAHTPAMTLLSPQTNPARASGNRPKKPPAQPKMDEVIRISVKKLDHSLDAIGELVVYQNMLFENCKKRISFSEWNTLDSLFSRINGIVKELQISSFSLRMVPLESVFTKMKRIVRDLSTQQNKPIDFLILGEKTEIDRAVVECISDPLTHLIRNAIDHGVEPAEERVCAGKPAVSTLTLSANQDGGRVIIEVKDDGRGLQKKKLQAKAIQKGILRPTDSPSDEEIFALIFHSGFSLKEEVTEVSGRGVGMDVVRSNIEALKGEIQIASVEGKGTTFRIILPLRLAIVDGMVCELGKQRFIIPLAQLNETTRVEPIQLGVVNQRGLLVKIRNEELPYYDLESLLENRRATEIPTKPFFAFISIIAGKKYLFRVKSLLGAQQIVIKKLGVEFQSIVGLAGTALMGDGTPGLILDINSIVNEKIKRVGR